jgi:hypothetical protein
MAPPKMRPEEILDPFSPTRPVSPASSKASELLRREPSPLPPGEDNAPPPAKRRSRGQAGSKIVDPIIINLKTKTITNKPRTPTSPYPPSAGTTEQLQGPAEHLPFTEHFKYEEFINNVDMSIFPKDTVILEPPTVQCENIRNALTDLDDCPHSASFSTPITPDAILSNPFAGNLLTCLRQIKTTPCDTVSPAIPSNPRHRIKVYGCYQQHWYPKINMPVLTLVAPCGVSISPPIFKRKLTHRATLKFIVSSTGQQEILKFELPLHIPRTLASSSVVMTHGPSSSCPDTLTSYILKSTSPDLNLAWIKVFHLSVLGCFSLHAKALYVPMRPASTSEIHILGLSAARHTTYQIMHQEPTHLGIKFLQKHELQAIGWKKNPDFFTNLWKPNTSVFIAPTPLLEQMQFTQPSFFPAPNTLCLVQRQVIPISDPSLVPLHYPTTKCHDPPVLAPAPQLFFNPTKLSPTVNRLKDITYPVAQILEKIKPPSGLTRKEFFLTLFNVPADTLENEALTQHDLLTFLDKFARGDSDTNGYCAFRHIQHSQEPFHYTVPRSWLYLTKHDTIKSESKRHQFPAQEAHDWA